MSLPELQQNPLVQRVIDIFDTDGNGEVDFKGEHQTRREAQKSELSVLHCRHKTFKSLFFKNEPL